MTIKEKAAAYDKALARAQSLYNDKNEIGYANAESVLEEVFPLLKEDKDEKTMKDLLNFLKSPFIKNNICDWKVAPWISWLEKQSKKKSAWDKDDDYRVEILYAFCEEEMNKSSVDSTVYRELQETRNWLHSLKERIGG